MNTTPPPADALNWPIKFHLPADATPAMAWEPHRLSLAFNECPERTGFSDEALRRADELLLAPGTTMADIEAKCRALTHYKVYDKEPFLGMMVLGPIGSPVDTSAPVDGHDVDCYYDRLVLSLLADIVRIGTSAPQPAPSSDTTWHEALAEFQSLKLKWDATGDGDIGVCEMEEVFLEAEKAMLAIPAPDMEAWKIRRHLMIRHNDPRHGDEIRVEHMDALIADLRRLA